jgi:hypothetical protein
MRSFACWDCGFESRPGRGGLFVASVVCCIYDGADPSSRRIVPRARVCVSLNVIRCNNNPLHLLWLRRRGRTKKKKLFNENRVTWPSIRNVFQMPNAERKCEDWLCSIIHAYIVQSALYTRCYVQYLNIMVIEMCKVRILQYGNPTALGPASTFIKDVN